MSSLVAFINAFLSYFILFALIIVLVMIAVFLGIKWRKNKDAKIAAETAEGEAAKKEKEA